MPREIKALYNNAMTDLQLRHLRCAQWLLTEFLNQLKNALGGGLAGIACILAPASVQ